MSEDHVALSSPKAREMVETVLGEFDDWAKYAPGQAAGMYPSDSEKAAWSALQDVRENLMDHLVIAVGATLASWELSDVLTGSFSYWCEVHKVSTIGVNKSVCAFVRCAEKNGINATGCRIRRVRLESV